MIHVDRLGRVIAVFALAVAGVFAVSVPVGAQPSPERLMLAQQGVPCSSLYVLRRELLSLSRTSTPTLEAMDSVIYRMSVIVPRVPRIPGSTLAVLLNNLKDQRAELEANGLSPELVARIQETARSSYGLFAFVTCV